MSAQIKTVLEVAGLSGYKSAFAEAGAAVKKWRGEMGEDAAGHGHPHNRFNETAPGKARK